MLTHRPPKKPDLNELRQSILGLILACPFDGTNPPDCQLYEIRQLSLKTRFEWVNGLTLEEAEAVWTNHEKCLMTKKIGNRSDRPGLQR
jgi:Fe-S-cluster containining protein